MADQPPRKKWSERQYELFLETAGELGPNVSKEEFDRMLEGLLNAKTTKSRQGTEREGRSRR
jgi:hypothetical protein